MAWLHGGARRCCGAGWRSRGRLALPASGRIGLLNAWLHAAPACRVVHVRGDLRSGTLHRDGNLAAGLRDLVVLGKRREAVGDDLDAHAAAGRNHVDDGLAVGIRLDLEIAFVLAVLDRVEDDGGVRRWASCCSPLTRTSMCEVSGGALYLRGFLAAGWSWLKDTRGDPQQKTEREEERERRWFECYASRIFYAVNQGFSALS